MEPKKAIELSRLKPLETEPIEEDVMENFVTRLQTNISTMADRMQVIVRALNENMIEEEEEDKPKPMNIKKIRSLKWAPVCGGETCAICQDVMHIKAKKLPCKHLFHPQCIIPWLKITASCPKCRENLE